MNNDLTNYFKQVIESTGAKGASTNTVNNLVSSLTEAVCDGLGVLSYGDVRDELSDILFGADFDEDSVDSILDEIADALQSDEEIVFVD